MTPYAIRIGEPKFLRISYFFLTTFAAIVSNAPVSVGASSPAPTVTLASGGVVRGIMNAQNTGAENFLGLRYAQAPIGNLRFKPTLTPEPTWNGIYDGSAYGDPCPQFDSSNKVIGSEDCLYLNVFRPKLRGGKLPVMVWLHGGGLIEGSGGAQGDNNPILTFDGGNLAVRGKVIVVTFNYRLGRLGWMAHPALTARQGSESGNYGFLDQVAALQWVQKNISSFGGDPTQVTLFGESSGGMSVLYHLTSPGSKGLYARAIVESGFADQATAGQINHLGLQVAGNLGCGSGTSTEISNCLLKVSSDAYVQDVTNHLDINFIGEEFHYHSFIQAVVDGVLIPKSIVETAKSGALNGDQILISNNTGDGLLRMLQYKNGIELNYDSASFQNSLNQEFGTDMGAKLYAQYNPSKYPTTAMAILDLRTDFDIGCLMGEVMNSESLANPKQRLYRGIFNGHFLGGVEYLLSQLIQLNPFQSPIRPMDSNQFLVAFPPPWPAFHVLDVPYVFQNMKAVYESIGLPLLPADAALQQTMLDYWSAFAYTGKPMRMNQPSWPVYLQSSQLSQVLSVPVTTEAHYHSAGCDLYHSIFGSNP